MFVAEVFANSLFFTMTLVSMFVFFVSSVYGAIGTEKPASVWFLFWGITCGYIALWIGYNLTDLQTHKMFNVFVFVELSFVLLSLICLCFAASNLIINNKSYYKPILIAAAFVMICIVYFVLISPNGNMVVKFRDVFPIVSLAYILIAFVANIKKSFGYIVASVTIVAMLIVRILDANSQDTQYDCWYSLLSTNILLSISILMIKADYIADKLIKTSEKIKHHSNQIENIISSSPFPMLIARLVDDSVIVANDNAVKLFDIDKKEMERYRLKDFFLEQENRKKLNELLEKNKEVKDFEILVKTSTGKTPFWLLTSANTLDYNNDIVIYLAFQDITSRKQHELMLKNQAIRDPLTALFNRRYFEEEVNSRIANNITEEIPFSVLMIDVDKFKRVNDTYGHKVGDEVLISLANTCTEALRSSDIVARYGGEEFVVYLHDTDKDTAKLVAERLRETIERVAIPINDKEKLNITASIGISHSSLSVDLDMLVKLADSALYTAKNTGRNKCVLIEKKSKSAKVNTTNSLHPVFEKEEKTEISLLDNIGANHIITVDNRIEEEKNSDFNHKIFTNKNG